MQDKINWMLKELRNDEYHLSKSGLINILSGISCEHFEDSLLDYVSELDTEWENSPQNNSSTLD